MRIIPDVVSIPLRYAKNGLGYHAKCVEEAGFNSS